MTSANASTRADRRSAIRYRMPGHARVFWPNAEATYASVADLSAKGCLVVGSCLPEAGTDVFLSLNLRGLPNLRLPAKTVRRTELCEQALLALRFELPAQSAPGFDRLLSQRARPVFREALALVVDSDARSRERIVEAASQSGVRVIAVSNTAEAVANARDQHVGVVLARCDLEGIAALAALSRESPGSFRVAFGRRDQVRTALALGYAQATTSDPCSAKVLSSLMQKKPPGGA